MLSLDNHGKVIVDVIANQGTAASRKAGMFFIPSDKPGFLYLSNGTSWIEVAPGAGSVPIGSLIDYFGAGDPADVRFVICDGRAVSRTTYSVLFALIGTTYGVGNGTTTFNIPDTRGRSTIGVGTASGDSTATAKTLGVKGGTEKHIHAVGSHTHTGAAPDHLHSVPAHSHTGGCPDHLHQVGSLYTADHAHWIGGYGTGGENSNTSVQSLAGGPLGLTRSGHAHGWGGVATNGSGSVAIGGQTGASDRGLSFTTSSVSATSGASDRSLGFTTSSATPNTSQVNNLGNYIVANKLLRIS
jgi:microcystin-dependent protein